ncbi:hypothetical protein [Flavobacterium ammonificans]|uniref:Outer membrane protein beta-barrel domain-containing protein n=1 Tax=Flavobacterium ammonificans TaxID=1751056 RepID=A0ABM7UY55_9FLAO|nr:hypothetical protein [Flavobacterium ammonificans]BDB52415.1 hypothetical protein GENT11_07270 [Flavobacterium ammonificans]
MKKLFLIISFYIIYQNSFAQEVYFYTGKNFTTYYFKNSSGASNPNLKNGSGNFYELGYTKPLSNEKINLNIGLALNEYNSAGGNLTNSYYWDTNYLSIQSRISYSILNNRNNFDILPVFGFNLGTIIRGKQTINGTYFDLTKEKEFSGLLVTPSLGLQVKYNLAAAGYISLGYNYCKGINLSNSTDQKLGFSSHQLEFGIHYAIN